MRPSVGSAVLIGWLGLWLSLPGLLHADGKHIDLENAFEKARNEFVTRVGDSDKKLKLAIEQRMAYLRKSGDKSALDRIQTELKAFEQDGTLPSSVLKASELYEKQLATARTRLEQVYRSQIKEYVKRFEDAKAKGLEKDLKQFQAVELGSMDQELIRFGDCDNDLVFSKSSGWVVVKGTWQRRTESPAPHAGSGHFWPAYDPDAELAQDIDVRKFGMRINAQRVKAVFSGFVRTLPQTVTQDTSRIILEFLDAAKSKLAEFDSSEISNIERWQEVNDARTVPVGTRMIRIRLIGKKTEGMENNGYFDSLSLKLVSATDRPVVKPKK